MVGQGVVVGHGVVVIVVQGDAAAAAVVVGQGVVVWRRQHFFLSEELQAADFAHKMLADLGRWINPPGQA